MVVTSCADVSVQRHIVSYIYTVRRAYFEPTFAQELVVESMELRYPSLGRIAKKALTKGIVTVQDTVRRGLLHNECRIERVCSIRVRCTLSHLQCFSSDVKCARQFFANDSAAEAMMSILCKPPT